MTRSAGSSTASRRNSRNDHFLELANRDFALDFLQQAGRRIQPARASTQWRHDGHGRERPAVRQRREDVEPRTAERPRATDQRRRNARAAPGAGIRPRKGDGPERRQAARRLELRAQPGDVERRRPLLLEPERAVGVLRPGRPPRTQRGRADLDVRRRLRQGPDGHRRVAVAQPGARNVRRRPQRTDQLRGDRAVPLGSGTRPANGLPSGPSPATAPAA